MTYYMYCDVLCVFVILSTLARLVMFNKRRGGEASKMLLESYHQRPDWKQVNNPEIMASLSGFERELSRRQVRY